MRSAGTPVTSVPVSDGGVMRLFADDPTDAQCWGCQTRPADSGERRLVMAVLRDAVQEWCVDLPRLPDCETTRLRRERCHRWFTRRDIDRLRWCASSAACCAVLGFDPDWIWRLTQAKAGNQADGVVKAVWVPERLRGERKRAGVIGR